MTSDPTLRRASLDTLTEAELAIRRARIEVERGDADVRLTDAVILLNAAQDAVADYIDDIARRRMVRTTDGLDGPV